MKFLHHGSMLVVLVICALSLTSVADAAPKARLWDRWAAHDPTSTARIDHRDWDEFLGRYVRPGGDGTALVAYSEVDQADYQRLVSYIDTLAATVILEHTQEQQLAYWINLYNALTVKVILDHYPVVSIRDINISRGLFASGPWGKALVKIADEDLSLDDIEHRILRPIWRDPRIHYGVNCASIGCPNLQRQAFTASNADDLLDQAAREYVNHPRGARFERCELHVSSIYDWFQEDFGGSDRGVIEHLRQFARPQLEERLQLVQGIADDYYDWRLNDAQLPFDESAGQGLDRMSC